MVSLMRRVKEVKKHPMQKHGNGTLNAHGKIVLYTTIKKCLENSFFPCIIPRTV